jgi:hypothetical protein
VSKKSKILVRKINIKQRKNKKKGGFAMKEKTKKWLMTAGLVVVGAALIVGIFMRLYKEEVVPVAFGAKEQEIDVMAEKEEQEQVPVLTTTPVPTATPAQKTELVIEKETVTEIDKTNQQIQPPPEKTETEKPKEPPVLQEGTDLENPGVVPAYAGDAEKPVNTGSDNQQNPVHGDTKDGMIYIDGFGWVLNEGGGGSGTVAEDMYENGNKIGIME